MKLHDAKSAEILQCVNHQCVPLHKTAKLSLVLFYQCFLESVLTFSTCYDLD